MPERRFDDQIIRELENLTYRLRNQRVEDDLIMRHRVRPIRSWDEQTRGLRFVDKVKLHRYPGGLANTTRWRRDQMVAAYRQRMEISAETARAQAAAIHEALAYALDAERFLGSLDRRDERDCFPADAIDQLAEHVLVWLEERGYQVLPLDRG